MLSAPFSWLFTLINKYFTLNKMSRLLGHQTCWQFYAPEGWNSQKHNSSRNTTKKLGEFYLYPNKNQPKLVLIWLEGNLVILKMNSTDSITNFSFNDTHRTREPVCKSLRKTLTHKVIHLMKKEKPAYKCNTSNNPIYRKS